MSFKEDLRSMFEYPPFPSPYWDYLTPFEKVRCCFWQYVIGSFLFFSRKIARKLGKELPDDLDLLTYEMVKGYGMMAFVRLISEDFEMIDKMSEEDIKRALEGT